MQVRTESPQDSREHPCSQPHHISYSFGTDRLVKKVESFSIVELFSNYGPILWEEGKHKENVRSFLGEINEILLGRKFSTFDQDTLDMLIGTLRERGNSNATINRKMAALSKLLRKACKMGDLFNLPEFRRQKEKNGRIRFLELEEEDRLFAQIQNHSTLFHQLSVFLVDSGARLSEATGMRWNDISDYGVTFWQTKSGRSRSIPLTRRVRAMFKDMKHTGPGPFTKVKQYQFRAVWHQAKEECGFSDDVQLVPHCLRHTCASRLVRGGIDIRRVQMWLGHQTLQMTMRYAHLATHDLDVCVPVLERRDSRGGQSAQGSPQSMSN